MSDKKTCINNLLSKISNVDKKIDNINERIKILKQIINDPNEEECPDVVESEKALSSAIENLFVEELLTREPEGDA
tara:strand:+ start:266 stop:493 length:228 start_codon:yes stop_codon:yes gene_type:complete